ncbi:NAD(P)H-dependent oxidoreductase [Paenibacillus alvei]|uniref:NAD(P)H-dependent oxidoreductase n=1 Tax=Paenibacillus TaxID=44249 RepID=UPI000287DA96|nr:MULTISPECIES: NAD(P)H-dependent oxidoreductase [Paenibacillus]EJW16036.1 general stress protein 14 [Paenibacillus alvei DSM 29]MCY9704612.1 NAD(P)H-dependent oxidoreductase [Paenibacillus alvei]MCY9732728.1 NAD(P)H-dependent oxidoreductase [Paenibacillus alvei]MCY9754951.1 NAD(P)H-dependent oxidoreductase [Paenibacillus alvei]MEC0079461.1 NAD(P)H-dependent oxidoreductase [Paenibacillus alvei]
MKTLVIVTHPNLETSVVNKRLAEELKKHPDKYTVHELYKAYPDGNIDVQQEQQLIESHGNLVLQFPIYWFNCPPLLKKWLDEVFTYGWAYGSNGGDKLKNRKAALAVSAGIKKEDIEDEGKYRYSLAQILSPFEMSFQYCKADYRSFYAFYGAENDPSESKLEQSALEYVNFIDNL